MKNNGLFATSASGVSARPATTGSASRAIIPTLLAALLAVVLLASPALADMSTKKKQPPQRKDNVFGTMNENMFMGTDPDTGDNIMRVEPPPPPAPPEDPELPPIEIQPQIIYTPKKQ